MVDLNGKRRDRKIIEHCNNSPVMGFKEVIIHLPRFLRIMRNTIELVKRVKPDRIILIDCRFISGLLNVYLNLKFYSHLTPSMGLEE